MPRRFQYQSFAKPVTVFDPANGFPWVSQPDFAPGPARLRWEGFVTPVHTALPHFPLADPVAFLPQFPDFPARKQQPLVPEGWVTKEHVGLPSFPVPVLSWAPRYDDFARAKDPLVPEGWVTKEHVSLPSFPVPALAWNPTYPDFTREQPPLRWEGFITPVQPSLPNFPVPALSWGPTYPDFPARTQQPLIPEGWVTKEHVGLPSFPIPNLAWNPTYPDFTRGIPPLRWEGWQIPQSTFTQNFAPSFNPASGFPWIQSVDFAQAAVDPNRWQGFITPVHPSLPSFPVPALAWNPTYPDFTRGIPPLRWEGWQIPVSAYFRGIGGGGGLPELFTVSEDNRISLPETGVTLTGLGFGFTAGQAVIISPTNDITDAGAVTLTVFTSWTDDRIVLDVTTGPVPGYWFVKTDDGLANLDGLFVTPVVPTLSWAPAYPDFTRKQQPLVQEGWVTPVHPALPSFPVPALSWGPTYPDFTRAQPLLRWEGWITPTHPALPNFPIPVLSWRPQYADFAPGRLWTVRDYGETYIPPWAPTLPAIIPKGIYIPTFRRRRR